MTCEQCGAPMELIRERDYYHCHYCGAYFFPGESPDGVRILGENPEGVKCPLCLIPLNMATFDEYYEGYQCSKCQGVMFNRSIFRITIEDRRARATIPAEPPTRYREEELQRNVGCPGCSQPMIHYQYMGPGNIIIDTCDACDLIWLDYGELSKVVKAPGRDRGEWHQGRYELQWEKSKKGKKERGRFGAKLLELIEDFILNRENTES
jgi:Zn-finger nucleic acid-binding protein